MTGPITVALLVTIVVAMLPGPLLVVYPQASRSTRTWLLLASLPGWLVFMAVAATVLVK